MIFEPITIIIKEYDLIYSRGKVDSDLANENFIIFGNAEEIRALILNLLDNTIKYSVDGFIKTRSYFDEKIFIIIENKVSPMTNQIENNLYAKN